MGVFDFILALYAIIAGLAISALVKGISRMIKWRDRLRPYWIHTAWLVFLFLVQVVNWFALWQFRDHTAWAAEEAVLLMMVPILLNAVSFLSVPEAGDANEIDMRAHYFEQAQWLQGLLFLSVLSGSIAVRVIEGRWTMTAGDLLRIGIMLVLLPGILSRRPVIHAGQMVCLLLLALLAVQRIVSPIGGSA
jgi:hypothetical protein